MHRVVLVTTRVSCAFKHRSFHTALHQDMPERGRLHHPNVDCQRWLVLDSGQAIWSDFAIVAAGADTCADGQMPRPVVSLVCILNADGHLAQCSG